MKYKKGSLEHWLTTAPKEETDAWRAKKREQRRQKNKRKTARKMQDPEYRKKEC